MSLRLLIAEDTFLFREALAQVFHSDRAAGVDVVGVVETSTALLSAIDRLHPDVVLTDIRMPPFGELDGVEIASILRDTHPGVGVVILSQYAEPDYALRLFESGSSGRAYLLKERIGKRAELLAAIATVADGGSVVDPKIVESLIGERVRLTDSPLNQLTGRERDVLAEVATGKSNTAIAAALFLTKRAVEKHITAIFLKLGLRDSDDVSRRVKAALVFLSADSGAQARH